MVIGRGSLDYSHAAEMQRAFSAALAPGTPVVADLREAAFIDSAILGCLVSAAMPRAACGPRLRVVVADDSHPKRVLDMVGFAAIMDIACCPPEETIGG